MVPTYDFVAVSGPVTVGYYKQKGLWHALAREFDLVGTGPTREAAFRQLQELVNDYVEASVMEGTREFFTRCPQNEWTRTRKRRERYLVTLVFERTTPRQKRLSRRIAPRAIDKLSRYSNRFVASGLVPETAGAL